MDKDILFSYDFVLLDFDGLLVDTELLHYKAYMQMIEEKGVFLSWDFARFCHEAHSKAQGVFVFLEREYPEVFVPGERDFLYQRKKKIYEELLQASPLSLMQGAEELLKSLVERQMARAVVTNSPRNQIEWIQDKIPLLQTIPLFVTREDYEFPKPSPEGYILAKKRLGMFNNQKGIGFEDTRKGVEALLAAGLDAVWVGKQSSQKAFYPEERVRYWTSLRAFEGEGV